MTFQSYLRENKKCLDSSKQDRQKSRSKTLEVLQKAMLYVAEKNKNNDAHVKKLKNEIVSLELVTAEIHEYNMSVQAECDNFQRISSEKQSELTQLANEIKRLESQQMELMEEFSNHRTVLNRQREALLITNGYFKERMQCYIQLDSPKSDVFIVAFFSTERQATHDYLVHIKYEAENRQWMLLDMKPKLACQPLLSKKLTDTADIQGFLFHVRKLFQEYIRAKA